MPSPSRTCALRQSGLRALPLLERDLFTDPALPVRHVGSVMVHELDHQWFGDGVSLRTWSDLWLNEGHATWYEALYAQERGDGSPGTRMDEGGHEASDGWRATGGPPAAPKPPEPGRRTGILRPNVSSGAALVLYALREETGRAAFERLERDRVTRHRDGTASTSGFVRLASHVAGRDPTGFLHVRPHGATTPPMPGHPERAFAARSATPARRPDPPVRRPGGSRE